jgi:hypothetical protein
VEISDLVVIEVRFLALLVLVLLGLMVLLVPDSSLVDVSLLKMESCPTKNDRQLRCRLLAASCQLLSCRLICQLPAAGCRSVPLRAAGCPHPAPRVTCQSPSEAPIECSGCFYQCHRCGAGM